MAGAHEQRLTAMLHLIYQVNYGIIGTVAAGRYYH